MGKAGRWLKSILLAGRKDNTSTLQHHQHQQQGDATPLPATASSSPRDKKRWSFRRPAQQGKAVNAAPSPLSSSLEPSSARELDQSEHAVAVAVAAAAAADAAVLAAAEAAAAVARLTAPVPEEESHLSMSFCAVEEAAAAARIQATFRGYLARRALCALRGLVKLQALVRGQLVRRQATATLRRMQALVDAQSHLRAQAKAQAQRARMLELDDHATPPAYRRRSPQHQHPIPRRRSSYEVMERSSAAGEEHEHVKIVEMDVAGDRVEPPAPRRGRSSCSAAATESRDRRLAEYYHHHHGGSSVGIGHGQCSPAPSSFFGGVGGDLSPPRAYSGHFDDALAFDPDPAAATAPHDAADGYVPSYMANTESSRAKARSQSAPRQRTDAALERQPSSRRRGGQGVAGAATARKMQRSSSHIGAAPACGYGYGYGYQQQQPPWAGVRLDRSSASMSMVGSECGSTTSSVLTTVGGGGYCRSLVGFEVQRGHY